MAGFHPHGDPYFPVAGNGWIDPDSDEEPMEAHEASDAEDSDPEEEPEHMEEDAPEAPDAQVQAHAEGYAADSDSDTDHEEGILVSDDEDDYDPPLTTGEVWNPLRPWEPRAPNSDLPVSIVYHRHRGGPGWRSRLPPHLGRSVGPPMRYLFELKEEYRPSAFEVGQSSQAPPPTAAPSRKRPAEEELDRAYKHVQNLEDRIEEHEAEIDTQRSIHTRWMRAMEERLEESRRETEEAEARAAELQKQLEYWMRRNGHGPGPQ